MSLFRRNKRPPPSVDIDWAYTGGKIAGRVHRQAGGGLPTFGKNDGDAERRAMRKGFRDGWREADEEMREAEAWTADGIEDELETWKHGHRRVRGEGP